MRDGPMICHNRVHSHAAAALINFCEGVARDTLVPYLDPIVERLLKLLIPPGEAANTVRLFPGFLDFGFQDVIRGVNRFGNMFKSRR
jgi:hypothetical protein